MEGEAKHFIKFNHQDNFFTSGFN